MFADERLDCLCAVSVWKWLAEIIDRGVAQGLEKGVRGI